MGHARLRLRGGGGEGTHYRLNQFGRHKAAMPLQSDRTKAAAGTSPFPITTRRERTGPLFGNQHRLQWSAKKVDRIGYAADIMPSDVMQPILALI